VHCHIPSSDFLLLFLPGFEVGEDDDDLFLPEQSDEYGDIDEAESHNFSRASELKL